MGPFPALFPGFEFNGAIFVVIQTHPRVYTQHTHTQNNDEPKHYR